MEGHGTYHIAKEGVVHRGRMVTRTLAVLATGGLLATFAAAAPSAAAEERSGRVDSAGVSSQEHLVEHTSTGRLDAVLTWDGSAALRLELRAPAGDLVASDDAGPSPRSIAVAVPPATYVLVVRAESGAADYLLALRAGGDGETWAGAVDSAGSATRSQPLSVPQEGVVTASLSWESTTADAAQPPVLRLAVQDATGAVVAETEGSTSPLQLEQPLELGEYRVSVTALAGDAIFEVELGVVTHLSTVDRVEAAYESGELTAREAADYSLWSALEPERVPEAYRAPQPTATSERDTLNALQYWDDLTPAAREELAAYLTPVELPAPARAQSGLVRALARVGPPWTDCGGATMFEVFLTDFHCVAGVDMDADGGPDLEVIYNAEGSSRVDDTDVGAPLGRPDQVDLAVEALTSAWRHYEALGFRPISDDLRVVLWSGMADGAGVSLPRWDDGGDGEVHRLIYMDTAFRHYLPRHELFHQFQYEYVGAPDLGLLGRDLTWWMEATAEWGAHEAEAVQTDPARRSGAYAGDLADVLGQPERSWDDTSRLAGGAEYGSFILAEYLDERFDGPGTIAQTWERIDNGFLPPRQPSDVVEEVLAEGDGFAEEAVRFRQWSYVLSGEPAGGGGNFGVGFTDQGEPDGVDDVETYWRPALQDDDRTAAGMASAARPRRDEVTLVRDAAALEGRVTLQRTGAAYVDLALPGGDRELRVTVRSASEDVVASLLPFRSYPQLCAAPLDVPAVAGGADDSLTWVVPSECTSATLVLTKASPHDAATPDVSDATYIVSSVAPPSGQYPQFRDPQGDTAEPAGDILEHRLDYRDGMVRLGVRVVDPGGFSERDDGNLTFFWHVDDEARRQGAQVYQDWMAMMYLDIYRSPERWVASLARVEADGGSMGFTYPCEGSVVGAFDGTWHTLTFPASCIGGPPQIWSNASTSLQRIGGPLRWDLAPEQSAYEPDSVIFHGPIQAGSVSP